MSKDPWHLDKRVPIALVLTMALQFGGAVWWGATINARVDINSIAIQRLDTRT